MSNKSIDRFLESIDGLDDELAALRGEYMNKCKGPREGIKETMSEIKDAGHNMKAFRVLLKKHRADRAHALRVDMLEVEDAEDLQRMLGEFGNTPLGAAAIDRQREIDEALNA